jgi:hypothetical protein
MGAERVPRTRNIRVGSRQSQAIILVVYSNYKLIKGRVGDLSYAANRNRSSSCFYYRGKGLLKMDSWVISLAWVAKERRIAAAPTLCRPVAGGQKSQRIEPPGRVFLGRRVRRPHNCNGYGLSRMNHCSIRGRRYLKQNWKSLCK